MPSQPRDPLSKVRRPEALKRALAAARKSRKKIVFTNGVFDLLHPGHVTYLCQARKLGQLLVVALNEDESVRKLKGPSRPVNRLSDRLFTLAGLECVDFVTWFGEETPLRLIELLRPDILVKGGDYSATAAPGSSQYIVGSKEIRAWGGKAKALPFVRGQSTTKTIARIK